MSNPRLPLYSTVERLEARIAPAVLFGQTIIYHDVDGALVHIKASSGSLEAVVVDSPDAQHQQLTTLFTSAAPGANITFTVGKSQTGGGLVNVGTIDSAGFNLGSVTIPGDLGSITCGNGSATVPAIKSLTVHSMGTYGTTTGSGTDGNGTLQSDIDGSVGSMKIVGNEDGAYLKITGGLHSLTIGGSLTGGSTINSGAIQVGGFLGAVHIGRNVEGGSDSDAGSITGLAGIGSINIGGSLVGGSATASGYILNNSGDMGPVTIKGDVIGGNGDFSGTINSFGPIASISVEGSLKGGGGGVSGTLLVQGSFAFGPVKIGHDVMGGSAGQTGSILSTGSLGAVTIGGSLFGIGHNGDAQVGTIWSQGNMGKVSIKGNQQIGVGNAGLIQAGGTLAGVSIGGFSSGSIEAVGNTGPVSIGGYFNGDVEVTAGNLASLVVKGGIGGGNFNTIEGNIGPVTIGGTFGDTGEIRTINGNIASIYLGGSLITGSEFSAGGNIGSVTIAHDVDSGGQISSTMGNIGNVRIGGDLNDGVIYAAHGNIGNVAVAGSVTSSEIVANVFTANSAPVKIGSVTVGGDWTTSSISAGYKGMNSVNYGNDTDTLLAPSSSIASIIIRGQIIGDTNPSDHFGFDATSIGHMQVGTNVVTLSGGVEDIAFALLTGGDVVAHVG